MPPEFRTPAGVPSFAKSTSNSSAEPVTDFPKYERYKNSGVEWLGDVPEHWEVERVFSAFNERVETGHPDLPNLNITIGRGVQVEAFEGARKKRLIEDLNAYKRARKGDIAYNTMRMWQGAVGDVPVDGLVSPAYVVARPIKPINSRFYSYLFRTETFQTETNRHSYGIVSDRNRLYWLGFKNITIPIPSREEQDRIVAFLDQKTAEIDALIAKKQRQIELLDEQKAILINRAVTRGLNPNAKLKPSGIEWIGDIPEHWEVKKIKYLISIQAGYAFKSSAYSQKDTDVRLLRGINVNPGQINWNDAVYWPHEKLLNISDFMLDSDDMVMGMDRPWVGAGVRIARVTEADLPALLLQRVARIRATGIEPDYLERTLTGSGFMAYFEPILTGVSVPHISPDQIACYVAAVPPKAEQIRICQFIKDAESLRDKTATTTEAQIQSLKILRSTLIANAVTGRIKI